MSRFQLVGLPAEAFAALAGRAPDVLARQGVLTVVADKNTGFPCRISLRDAEVGEALYLLPYEHQPANSPYRASGAIYVRQKATTCGLAPGVVPEYVTRRQISLRAYDRSHMMIAAEVCEGDQVAGLLEQMFEQSDIDYVHLHNAKRGCYSCLARRVGNG